MKFQRIRVNLPKDVAVRTFVGGTRTARSLTREFPFGSLGALSSLFESSQNLQEIVTSNASVELEFDVPEERAEATAAAFELLIKELRG